MPYLDYIEQKKLPEEDENKVLHFGPVSCSLGKLFEDGCTLVFQGAMLPLYVSSKTTSHKIYLVKGDYSWVVGRVKSCELISNHSRLSQWVKDGYKVAFNEPKPPKIVDPWELLKREYPKVRKPKPLFFGNRTTRQVLDDLGLGI